MTATPQTTTTNADAETMTAASGYTIDRYYYTPDRRFEQSIDVYKPLFSCPRNKGLGATTTRVPVVLVMGSGWLGHRPYFYTVTNWWNSSAPKQICGNLGHPCVSIRHSGGYITGNNGPCSLGSASTFSLAAFAGLLVVALLWLAPSLSPLFVLSVPLLLAVLHLEGKGAAGIEDMVGDVSTALRHIDQHALEWGLGDAFSKGHGESNHGGKKIPIVFGGYSSGAHVAATLLTVSPLSPLLPPRPPRRLVLQWSPNHRGNALDGARDSPLRPSEGEKDNEPEKAQQPQQLENLTIGSVLYVSGVLDVCPESRIMSLVSILVLGKHPSEVPSPLRTLRSSSSQQAATEDGCNAGRSGDGALFSKLSLPPHIVIGCKREVFGWSVLDSSFCAKDYTDALWAHRWKLRGRSTTHSTNDGRSGNNHDNDGFVRLVLLEGWAVNHWSVLSSLALRNALRTVLSGASRDCGNGMVEDPHAIA